MNDVVVGLITGFAVPAGIGLAVGLFAKFLPKEKTFQEKISPTAVFAADFLQGIMGKYLQPATQEKIEEGFFCTLAHWAVGWIRVFETRLLENNQVDK